MGFFNKLLPCFSHTRVYFVMRRVLSGRFGWDNNRISHFTETTTFHGFIQHDSSMPLTCHGLFCEGKSFYRGDLAGITTVYPILLTRWHFMVFFNMTFPCLSHTRVYSVRGGRVFIGMIWLGKLTVHPILLARQHFMVFFNMILPCLSHTRVYSVRGEGFLSGWFGWDNNSLSHCIETTTTFHGFLQPWFFHASQTQGLFREEEGFYRGDLTGITYSISHSMNQRHFMVFFNMILPCLSHAMVYSMRWRVFIGVIWLG
jgi:hypothetical protein